MLFLQHLNRPDCVDVWIMKDYGNIESWTFLASVATLIVQDKHLEYVNVIGLKAGKIWVNHVLLPEVDGVLKFAAYVLKDDKLYNVSLSADGGSVFNITSYEPSFVLPYHRYNKYSRFY